MSKLTHLHFLYRPVILLLCISFRCSVSAQEVDNKVQLQVDSISSLIQSARSVVESLEYYFERAILYEKKKDFTRTIDDYWLLLKKEVADQNPVLYARASIELGRIYQEGSFFNLDSSLYYSEQAFQLFDQLPDTVKVQSLMRLTDVNYASCRIEQATEYCLECIKLAKATDNINGLRYCYKRMASFSYKLNEYGKVKEYTDLFLALALEDDDPDVRSYYYYGAGVQYSSIGMHVQALSYFDSCEKYIHQGTQKSLATELALSRGATYGGLDQVEMAEQNFLWAWKLADSFDLVSRKMHAPLSLALLALSRKRYRKAIEYAEHVLMDIPEKLTLYELEEAHRALYLAYKGVNQYDKALESFELFNVYKDSSNQTSNIAVITGIERKYKNQEQKQHIDRQQKEIELQARQGNLIVIFFIALALFSLGLTFFYFKMKASNNKVKNQNFIILEQSNKLHQLDKVKSRFFANVSHELRTPLTLILGPISAVLKNEELSAKGISNLQRAKQNGQKILQLIGSILDLSKLESGKMELKEETIILFPFIRCIISAFESNAQRQHIDYKLDYQAEEDLQLSVDKDKLEIIFNNLISNALKFTPAGGEIIIKVKDHAHAIQISISDTGRGIHPDDLSHVFNRFYQSSQADAPAEGGTGIGLALSQEFVHLLGGEITVKSTLDEGSQFVFTFSRKEVFRSLPALNEETKWTNEVEKNAVNEKRIINRPSKTTTILLVEDNHILREYLQDILGKYYKVVPAENGKMALDLLSITPECQLILSDIMMPIMDGYQLLRKLKSNDRYRHLPVIMLTARADIQDKLKALRIGVDDYLLKPFEEEELLVRIANLLKNAKQRQKYIEITDAEPESVEEKGTITSKDQEWIAMVESTILEYVSNPQFSIDFLGEKVGLGRRQMQRKIRKIIGLSPKGYINHVRLHRARQLLETGGFTKVKTLALSLGFLDEAYFSRQFKKRFGNLPSVYSKSTVSKAI